MNHISSVATEHSNFYYVFFTLVVVMLAIDMFTLKSKGTHKISVRESLSWTVVWIFVSCLFGGWLYYELIQDPSTQSVALEKTLEYFAAYLLEKSLSIDNIFVFILIFGFFKIPAQYQHKVLLYGVLTAIILRIIMISLGVALVNQFSWILYIFGFFLVYSGIKMLFTSEDKDDGLEKNRFYQFLVKVLPVKTTSSLYGAQLTIKIKGVLYATPLLLALIMIEISDIIFAVDSIPAVFSVTTDPFIIISSNIFAILGLRAMYFLLSDIIDKFAYLKYGLAMVLVFIGIKMLIVEWYHIPIIISLSIIFILLFGSIIISFFRKNKTYDQ